ncbi:MAG: hypothetical protein ACLFV7_02930 [Phycisphaerae bacterium]
MSETQSPLDELEQLLAAVREYPDPRRATTEWKQIYRILGKTDLPPSSYQGVVGMRDVPGLEKLLEQLRSPAEAPPGDAPDPATCRKALHAFRKRARLTRLDDESKLGRSPLSKGSDETLSAITPPSEYPSAVWQELVRQGKLRSVGNGLYQLTTT